MNVCKLYVVRHGESEHNRDDIVSGHVDPQLTETGRVQALATRQKLADVQFDDAYSSDLQRAADTAEIIYGKPVSPDHRLHELRERNFGVMDGKPGVQMQEAMRHSRRAYQELSPAEQWRHNGVPGMESDYEVSERFVEALARIAQANPGKTILVAAHGGTLRTMLIKLGYATRHELPSGSIDNASYVELDYANGDFTVGKTEGVNRQL